ncbi:hypothetical protein LPTSP4_13970 [Leptospira ryugenii]|uniref:Uncharacterized protein n=1 Tax=Leptospira ryugenii TaxID=1917863 RepID=A0A2P2DZ23_9LEPT|nr:hypothetical protein [Leptospira ryugenii]GBF49877.1 hypothetical protein LPTSP4_13970 [Leptospira ryugenii]
MTEKKLFLYNTDLFRKKLLQRTLIVLSMFVLFLGFNTLQIPAEERPKFLLIFLPLFAVLVWFLRKNFTKQLEILTKGMVELQGGTIKQFDAYGSCAAIRNKDIEKITRDKFRGYERIIIETKERIFPIVNLQEIDAFTEELRKETKLEIVYDNEDEKLFTWKNALFMSPSIFFLVVLKFPGLSEKFPFLNLESFYLFFNVNVIIFFLYLPEKPNYLNVKFSFKRRMLFISLVLFLFQVYINLNKAGFFES